jgi:hypothetical protein
MLGFCIRPKPSLREEDDRLAKILRHASDRPGGQIAAEDDHELVHNGLAPNIVKNSKEAITVEPERVPFVLCHQFIVNKSGCPGGDVVVQSIDYLVALVDTECLWCAQKQARS